MKGEERGEEGEGNRGGRGKEGEGKRGEKGRKEGREGEGKRGGGGFLRGTGGEHTRGESMLTMVMIMKIILIVGQDCYDTGDCGDDYSDDNDFDLCEGSDKDDDDLDVN